MNHLTRLRKSLALATVGLGTALLGGCGPKIVADISGLVDGSSFVVASAYWGGPFLVFFDLQVECMDAWWVSRNYADGDEPPVDYPLLMVQFTFNESDVTAGNYNVAGQAPVDAVALRLADSTTQVWDARDGSLVIDSVGDQEPASGNFHIYFDNGEVEGNFEVDYCNNLKSKY